MPRVTYLADDDVWDVLLDGRPVGYVARFRESFQRRYFRRWTRTAERTVWRAKASGGGMYYRGRTRHEAVSNLLVGVAGMNLVQAWHAQGLPFGGVRRRPRG